MGKNLGRQVVRREPYRGDRVGRIGLHRRHGDKFRAELGGSVRRQVRLSRNLVWQTMFDGAAGNAVAVGPDGSVYAAGTTPRPDQIGNFDLLVLKITSDGSLVWQRTYTAGEVVDPRGRMTTAPDGSIVLAGAIQAAKAGLVDIAALIVKGSPTAACCSTSSLPDGTARPRKASRSLRTMGRLCRRTTTSFGAGSQDAFVLHLEPTGKKALGAVTWGGTGFETGAGVAVNGSTVSLAATTTAPPPYSLRGAAAKLSAPKGTLSASEGNLDMVAGVVTDPGLGAATPNGSTTYGGNFEAALARNRALTAPAASAPVS